MFRWIHRSASHSKDGVIDTRELAADRGLHLLSVVIPARNEERCIAATVEHLHLELEMRNVPHEIVVVDDVYLPFRLSCNHGASRLDLGIRCCQCGPSET